MICVTRKNFVHLVKIIAILVKNATIKIKNIFGHDFSYFTLVCSFFFTKWPSVDNKFETPDVDRQKGYNWK